MFSIVTPLYNKKDCIARTLDCVLRQTFGDFEMIVVDDGSTDGGDAVAAACTDPRIRMVRQANAGAAAARNAGIAAATRPYIAFLDADDLWDPDYLTVQAALIRDFPEACVWGVAYRRITRNIHVPQPRFGVPERFRGMLEHPWSDAGCGMLWTSALVVRKAAVEQAGGFDPRIAYGEDLDLWFRLLLQGKAAFERRTLAGYVHDVKQKTPGQQERLFTRYFPCYIEKFTEARAAQPGFRRYYDRQCLLRIFPYFAEGKLTPEMQQVLRAIRLAEQPLSFRLRFRYPKIYCYYCRFVTLCRAAWKRLTSSKPIQ